MPPAAVTNGHRLVVESCCVLPGSDEGQEFLWAEVRGVSGAAAFGIILWGAGVDLAGCQV